MAPPTHSGHHEAPAPLTLQRQLVTPPPRSLLAAVVVAAVWVLFAAIPLAVEPTARPDGRVVVERVDGDDVTVQVIGAPQPNRFVVHWDEVDPGDTVAVDLTGPCRCVPEPATVSSGERFVGSVFEGTFLVLALCLAAGTVTVALLARNGFERSRSVIDLPEHVYPVWARPVWVGTSVPRLHLDVHHRSNNQRIGRLRIDRVVPAMNPWEPYALVIRQGHAALVSEDGRRAVCSVRPLDRIPSDAKVAADGAACDVALRWGPNGSDPRWAAATARARRPTALRVAGQVVGPVAWCLWSVTGVFAVNLVTPIVALAAQVWATQAGRAMGALVREVLPVSAAAARRATRAAVGTLATTGTLER